MAGLVSWILLINSQYFITFSEILVHASFSDFGTFILGNRNDLMKYLFSFIFQI